MGFLQEMANREKHLWATLVVDVLVAAYYFPQALVLFTQAEPATGELVGLVVTSTILGIVLAILAHFVFGTNGKATPADEREVYFAARASKAAFVALQTMVVFIIWQVSADAFVPAISVLSIQDNPLFIAHLLLLALMVSRLIKSVSELISFRKAS